MGGVIYFVFFLNLKRDALPEDNKILEQEVENANEVDLSTKVEPTPVNNLAEATPAGSESLKRMALSFAERFGSYSNHSNYSNINDLKVFMTKEMQVWADKLVLDMKAKKSQSDIYYGITTKAVLAQEKKFDDDLGQAEFLVKTQRRVSTGDMGNMSITYQDILISFTKESGAWKVNQAVWK